MARQLSDINGALKQEYVAGDIVGTGESGSPAALKLKDTDGVAWYLFVETDGTVKVHTAVPTQDSDGSVVGAQT